MKVVNVASEADGIKTYELREQDGAKLPSFTAGSHIGLRLGNSMARSYSLTNAPGEQDRYRISVLLDRQSRGGSKWLHENVDVGSILSVDEPRNTFALNEEAERTLFIAGGIGITPFISMIARLEQLGQRWDLVYYSRNRSAAAYLSNFAQASNVDVHFSDDGAALPTLDSLVRSASETTSLYCCGPGAMVTEFERITADIPPARVHLERFNALPMAADRNGFTVNLVRSGKTFFIPTGQSILSVLQENKIEPPFSCGEGLCGACETTILNGEPDHLDYVLTQAERETGKKMMICCSRAKSPQLDLDL